MYVELEVKRRNCDLLKIRRVAAIVEELIIMARFTVLQVRGFDRHAMERK